MNKKEIEEQVLQKTTPTNEFRQKTQKTVEKLKKELEEEIKKRKLNGKPLLEGSTAKDTYLMNSMDIDFFITYEKKFSKEKIAQDTLSIAKKILTDTEESYADHPYLKGKYNGFDVEIVPCYKIEKEGQILSAVDRTPLHTEYIKKTLKETQKKQVRLFKQFLKGIKCYGAEAQIQGFSGYLCEILIIKYNTFTNLLKNAKNWRKGVKLTLNNQDSSDFNTPLVFIDPVDSNRNVASALKEKTFNIFVKASKEYLKNPNITFFFPNPVKPWNLDKIKKTIEKQGYKYTAVEFKKPDIIDENFYPQARKAKKAIKEACERQDFEIIDDFFFVDEENKKVYLIFKTHKEPLSDTYTHQGPPVKLEKNKKIFIDKWRENPKTKKGPYIEDKRVYVELKRDYKTVEKYLKENLQSFSLGKTIDKTVEKDFNLIKTDDLMKDSLRSEWTEYLDGKMPWER